MANTAHSALYYIGLNLKRPSVRTTPGEYTRLMINRADVYAHAGLFSDALATMAAIPHDSLNDDLLDPYYTTYCDTYQYLSEYTNEHETSLFYERRRSDYADSLSLVIDPESFNHLVYGMTELARDGDPEQAIEVLTKHLDNYPSGTREYSILASILAHICKTADRRDEYKRYIVLSAISDVQGAVKENVSFRELATVMFEDGDIERANRYLKKSIADANFYSALMRNAQSSKMLPVIDEAYSSAQNELTDRLRSQVWISSILSVILLVTILWILKQVRSLRRAKDDISKAHEELSEMSTRLKETNIELAQSNTELQEYNRTKEQYAGLFMEYCSSAISTLQRYQLTLQKLTTQGGNRAALLKKLESSEVADQLLKDFYVKFDEAILNIYPAFVEKFNALLKDGEKIVLKTGEQLNTELRLFALVRLGIDDSAKIAQFLRCSIATVYTYRSKIRKRAIDPDNFENEVKNID
ncbi:MAG: hypothetical protein K2K84_06155 [Muribaculaceae bacterium]|nr:hypothetical protein [Muribaculaceae bacterium]